MRSIYAPVPVLGHACINLQSEDWVLTTGGLELGAKSTLCRLQHDSQTASPSMLFKTREVKCRDSGRSNSKKSRAGRCQCTKLVIEQLFAQSSSKRMGPLKVFPGSASRRNIQRLSILSLPHETHH